jgi:recombination protein RecR
MKIHPSIRRFVDILSALPGIGPRQAIRLAFYSVGRGPSFQKELADAIADLQKIGLCKQCFYIQTSGNGLCEFCGSDARDQGTILIVEKETDVMSVEDVGSFNGRYLVLGDVRKNGILETDQKLRLKSLKSWIEKEQGGKAKEIIIGINPTTEGDILAGIIAEEMKPFAKKVTRLGRGIPTGGEIEFADKDTLKSAIQGRS